MRKFLTFLLHIYRRAISPYLGSSCRYYPTCSQYALDALDQYGAARGSWMAMMRILRCHPWRQGGYDPVPKNCCQHHEVKSG
ncbi:MAG: membrane protein insertion efficiency factor YidD [Acidiferrobacterales bacterium]